MSGPSCEEVLARIASGDARTTSVSEHLERCAACAAEAESLEGLLGLLSRTAELEPPVEVDRRVRARIATQREPARSELRPVLAVGLALAALLALAVGISIELAQSGAAELGPIAGTLVLSVYLAFNSAAILPLFLNQRMRTWTARR